jgi:hypothetical protein
VSGPHPLVGLVRLRRILTRPRRRLGQLGGDASRPDHPRDLTDAVSRVPRLALGSPAHCSVPSAKPITLPARPHIRPATSPPVTPGETGCEFDQRAESAIRVGQVAQIDSSRHHDCTHDSMDGCKIGSKLGVHLTLYSISVKCTLNWLQAPGQVGSNSGNHGWGEGCVRGGVDQMVRAWSSPKPCLQSNTAQEARGGAINDRTGEGGAPEPPDTTRRSWEPRQGGAGMSAMIERVGA